jgi:colanic acid biosynthesis glycosyl transferase WcaI
MPVLSGRELAGENVRILALSINYWPDQTGIAAFNRWRCEYLASRGHEVTICTGPPYYPEWRVPNEYRKLWQREKHNGVNILRSWMFVPRRVTTKKRMLHEVTFLASSFARALGTRRPELIYAVSPPLGLALTASALSRLWRVPFVFDVEDLQPDAALELGMVKEGALIRGLYRVERLAYERAALISTLTEGMRHRILQKGIDPAKVVLFPPRADSTLYDLHQRFDGEEFRRRHGLQGKFLVTHSGNMGVKQGMEVILETAARSLHRPDLQYLFVGNGAMRPYLEAEARLRKLNNVLFLPLLENEEFQQLLAATGISLITQQRVVSNIVFPSKTVTLLCAGCPVIASVNEESEVARAVVRSGAGVVVEPEDAGALYQTIDQLSRSPEVLARMSVQARQYAEQNWDEGRTLPRMEELLVQCVERWRSQKHSSASNSAV